MLEQIFLKAISANKATTKSLLKTFLEMILKDEEAFDVFYDKLIKEINNG